MTAQDAPRETKQVWTIPHARTPSVLARVPLTAPYAGVLTESEQHELSARGPGSAAAVAALKTALAELVNTSSEGPAIAEGDFVLGHDQSGAPVVVSVGDTVTGRIPPGARFLVSASHTFLAAYGLACLEFSCRNHP